MGYSMRRARPEDLGRILDVIYTRIDWLREIGSDQWSTRTNWDEVLRESIADQRAWVAVDETDHIVGTITLDTDPDTDFWPADDRALYLSKMAADPAESGKNVGGFMLDWACNRAAALGLDVVRLDVWLTATDLHAYYERQGFEHVDTKRVPGRYSGALFEKAVRPTS